MQHIYKIFFLYFYRKNSIYKIIKILINIIMTFTLLSGCNTVLKRKYFLIKQNNTDKSINKKNNDNFSRINISENNILINKKILIKQKSNFLKSAWQSGLNKYEIKELIKAIKWQTDLRKLSVGSNFTLVFSHNVLENKNTLLGVKFNNAGKKYYSIRAFNNNFYDINGFSKDNDCINCSFFKKYRISSKFNLHRVNPVTHLITPHLGIDLAMVIGTPVISSSNGMVIKADFNKIAGFYISVKNKNNYITRYMHLKKILVKIGDKIKIGQKIALSGNSGRTTGPHLHYEIWIDNQAVNPIDLKFIFCQELIENEKKIYVQESKKILKILH